MSGTKILIAEDESVVALDLRRRLERRGYSIVGRVSKGEEVLPHARNSAPDMVLMDIGLRGSVDGISAASQLADELKIPSIFVTAHADERTIERAQLAEPYGYLIKPFKDGELYASIQVGLYRHRQELRRRNGQPYSVALVKANDAVSREHSLEAFDQLRQIEAFETIPETGLQMFADTCVVERLERGQLLYHQGDPFPSPFLVCTGKVSMTLGDQGGKDMLLDFVLPGDLDGLASALHDGPALCTARIQEDAELLLIPKTGLILLLDEHPRASLTIARYMCGRLGEANRFSRSIAVDTAEQRIASALFRLHGRSGGSTRLQITRRQLAEMTGITVETAVRNMKVLEARGVLRSARPGTVEIASAADLARIANSSQAN